MKSTQRFNSWNKDKQKLQNKKERRFYPKIRQVWYAKLGVNIGYETDGKKLFSRPVLILAQIGSMFWVTPLTSKLKINLYHHQLQSICFNNIEQSLIILSQARTIDRKRFLEKIGTISNHEFSTIQKKMKNLYFPPL